MSLGDEYSWLRSTYFEPKDVIKQSIVLPIYPILCVLPAAAASFTDVPSGCWYERAVEWAVSNGLTVGVGDGKFGPGLNVTRAQVVTMLWRLHNSPAPSGNASFSDVSDGKWYTTSVLWAAGAGVVAGYPNGTFAPNRVITRQELVTMLYSYVRYRSGSITAPDLDLSSYQDAGSISPYARESFRWAISQNIISGTSATTLSPGAPATRAQFVQMLYRCYGGEEMELPILN